MDYVDYPVFIYCILQGYSVSALCYYNCDLFLDGFVYLTYLNHYYLSICCIFILLFIIILSKHTNLTYVFRSRMWIDTLRLGVVTVILSQLIL